MRKILIPFLNILIATAALRAQDPITVGVSGKLSANQQQSPEMCNDAGTFQFGQFIGQSNDISPDTIYLCAFDSLFLDHNGNANLSGDPNPATAPGVVYGFYTCRPTVTGQTLANLQNDPCIWKNSVNMLPIVAAGNAQGDIWLSNSGALVRASLGTENGVQYWFAATTIDDFAGRIYENGGPCVNVNVNNAFSVVYLDTISISNVSFSTADNCVGTFRIGGGLPAFNNTASYKVEIFQTNNPSKKAVILTNGFRFNQTIEFSVNEPGTYTIRVEDGKSCVATRQVVMSACNVTNAPVVTAPDTTAGTGTSICIPFRVNNFNVAGVTTFSLSVNWDPTVLSYNNFTTSLPGFSNTDLNTSQTANGSIGFLYADPTFGAINAPNGSQIFQICFNVIGAVGTSSPITFSGNPTKSTFGNIQFNQVVAVFTPGSVLVTNPSAPDFDTRLIAQNCQTRVEVTALGGSGPFTINWSPGAGMGTIASLGGKLTTPVLSSGVYTFRITDATGATATKTVTVTGSPLGATLTTVAEPSCFGSQNGSLRANLSVNGVVVPNPGPQYTFVWSPALPSAPLQSGLGAGAYAVTVTDTQSGCSTSASGSLTQPPVFERDVVTPVNASCPGATDGSISYRSRGGTNTTGTNYTYNWTYAPTVAGPFTTFQSNISANPCVLNNLRAGVYRVTVTDRNGCSFTDAVTIGNAKTVGLTPVSINNVRCFGERSGSLQINVTTTPNTPGTYGFVWTPQPAGSTPTNTPTSSTLPNLPVGTYVLVATETATGCSARDTFRITQPDSIRFTPSVVNPTCLQPNTGRISLLNVTGGTPPFTYNWSTSLGSGGQANGLIPGTYTVTISDANQCTKTYTTTLRLPNPPTVVLDSTSVKCGGDGCVKATGIPTTGGGNAITAYNWANLTTGTSIGNAPTVCKLNGGVYVVTVTANDGCTVVDTISLFQPNILKKDTVTYRLPRCFGDSDGIVGVTMSGGATPYAFNWSRAGSPSTPALVGVPAGVYTVTVTDNNGCTVVVTTELLNPPRIQVAYTSVKPARCYGQCNGEVIPVVTYNPPTPTLANFNFTWSSGETDSIPNNLCAGFNYVTISDPATNCFIKDSVIITQPLPFDLDDVEITPPSCAGDSNASVLINAMGSNGGPYIYDWGFTLDNPVDNLWADTFQVIVTDIEGCVDTTQIIIGEPNPVLVAINFGGTSDVICNGDQNGVAQVLVTGGNQGAFTFQWSNSPSTTAVATDLAPGVYFVTATDSNGCTGVSDSIIINNPPPVSGSYLPWQALLCAGDQTTLEIDTIFGGSGGPYQFTIDYGVELPADFPVSITGGQHIITYLDRFGCSADDTIFVAPGIDIQINFGQPVVEIELGDTLYQLNPNITGGTIDQFTWTPADKLSNPNSLRPFVTTFESQTYVLTVTDPNGCTGQAQIFVKVDPNRNIFIPNVFDPADKSSTLNNRWKIFAGLGVERVNYARVYDRWGENVYTKENFLPNNDDYSEGWDGTFRGRNLNPGVYVYLVQVAFKDGRVLLYRGDVTLLR